MCTCVCVSRAFVYWNISLIISPLVLYIRVFVYRFKIYFEFEWRFNIKNKPPTTSFHAKMKIRLSSRNKNKKIRPSRMNNTNALHYIPHISIADIFLLPSFLTRMHEKIIMTHTYLYDTKQMVHSYGRIKTKSTHKCQMRTMCTFGRKTEFI